MKVYVIICFNIMMVNMKKLYKVKFNCNFIFLWGKIGR